MAVAVAATAAAAAACSTVPPSAPEPESEAAVHADVRARAATAVLVNASAPPDDLRASASCTGVLVAPAAVLTAAHCLEGRAPTSLHAVVGADTLCRTGDVGGERRGVVGASAPPAPGVDVVVLELDAPVAAEPLRVASPPEDAALVASGWGRSSPAGPRPCLLVDVPLRAARPELCSSLADDAGRRFRVEQQICAAPRRGAARNTCTGDSGGPVTAMAGERVALVAVTSWGASCEVDAVGVYERLDPWSDWLAATAPQRDV